MNKDSLRTIVRGAYDLQKLRIQTGNRIVANFKAKLGQLPSKTEEESLDAKGKEILAELRKEHRKLTDGLKKFPNLKDFKQTELISEYTEMCLIDQYIDIERNEDKHFHRLETHILPEFPIYKIFLQKVKGCGPAMSGVIISEVDIHKSKYPSSLKKYAGLDVGPDGKGRSKKAEHLIEVEYVNKEGETKTKKSISFNPFLHTKLIGVLAPSFLKCVSPYTEVYYNTKSRLEQHVTYKDTSKGHRHNMAIRKMLIVFLLDLYKAWRPLEGLEVSEPYEVAKLGYPPHTERPPLERVIEAEKNIPVERVGETKKTKTVKKAIGEKRVRKNKTPVAIKRVIPLKKPVTSKRVKEKETTKQKERVTATKKPKVLKRVNKPKKATR